LGTPVAFLNDYVSEEALFESGEFDAALKSVLFCVESALINKGLLHVRNHVSDIIGLMCWKKAGWKTANTETSYNFTNRVTSYKIAAQSGDLLNLIVTSTDYCLFPFEDLYFSQDEKFKALIDETRHQMSASGLNIVNLTFLFDQQDFYITAADALFPKIDHSILVKSFKTLL
jgi:hypothetical protein